MPDWFGAPWATVAAVAAGTTAMYGSTLAAVRIAGRRTLAEISAFDVVVTIAIGSLLATTAVSEDPALAQGLVALVTLLALQAGIAALRRHVPASRRLLDFPPRILYGDGRMHLDSGVLGPQITEDELRSALRRQGHAGLDGVALVVLEPSGRLSVLGAGESGGGSDDPASSARAQ